MVPQKCPCPSHWSCQYVTLYGKRDFAGLSNNFEVGRLTWITQKGSVSPRVLTRGKQGQREKVKWGWEEADRVVLLALKMGMITQGLQTA